MKQNEFKLLSDSMAYVAEQQNFRIAENQLQRQQTLYDEGLKSLTEFQEKEQGSSNRPKPSWPHRKISSCRRKTN